MPLNIKDETVHRQAKRLAAVTGHSITRAVGEAIDEKLVRLERAAPPRPVRSGDAILALARQVGALMPPDMTSADHAALLYGPDGLPK